MQNGVHSWTDGWLVTARQILSDGRTHQILFATSLPDPKEAIEAVSVALGRSQLVLSTACRLSPRALMRLRIKLGEVKRI